MMLPGQVRGNGSHATKQPRQAGQGKKARTQGACINIEVIVYSIHNNQAPEAQEKAPIQQYLILPW